MNIEQKSHWLDPSPPLAVDGGDSTTRAPERRRAGRLTHSVRVRDRRERFGDENVFAAECECGWTGESRMGTTAERAARRDGEIHLDEHRPPHGHRGRG
jgi:hypothetical protein